MFLSGGGLGNLKEEHASQFVLRLFYGPLALASEMDTVIKPSSKRRSRIITAGKPPSFQGVLRVFYRGTVLRFYWLYVCSYRVHLSGDNRLDRYITA